MESQLDVGRVSEAAVAAFERSGGERPGGGELSLRKLLAPPLADASLAARQLRDAARMADMPTLRTLIDSGRVKNTDEGEARRDYETALLLGAGEGHVAVVDALLAAGAEPDLANAAGWTALHRAAMWGHTEVAAVLVRGGASLHVVDRHGNTAREIAAQYGNGKVVDFLSSVGAPDSTGLVGMHTDAVAAPRVALSGALDADTTTAGSVS